MKQSKICCSTSARTSTNMSEKASVMNWANMLLERRFFSEAIPKVLGQAAIRRITLDDKDWHPLRNYLR